MKSPKCAWSLLRSHNTGTPAEITQLNAFRAVAFVGASESGVPRAEHLSLLRVRRGGHLGVCGTKAQTRSHTSVQICLKLGFFDELHCSQILSLSELKLPGNYSIQSVACDMKKQLVSFTITKSVKRARVDTTSTLSSLLADSSIDSEMLRLRTIFDVKDADAQSVVQALRAVTRGFDRTEEWNLSRCAHRPGLYVLYLSLTGSIVPDESVRAAAEHQGVVDFENKQIIISIDKSQSDIY